MVTIQKPEPGEYAPYAIMYIDLVDENKSILSQLQENLESTGDLIQSYSNEQLSTACVPGEWTIKEILTHIMDTERIFCYRALCISRNDQTDLPGYDQDDYIANIEGNKQDIDRLLEEYAAMRQATITFFENMDEKMLTRCGKANNNPLSVRAAAWIIAGHELHHINSIPENYKQGKK